MRFELTTLRSNSGTLMIFDAAIAGDEIESRLRSLAEAARRLQTIPGIGPRTAQTILAEVGPDMSRFPTAGHLASWSGLCPGDNESASKRKSGRIRKDSPWIPSALVEAGQAAGRTKTYLGDRYHRLAARRGAKRVAVAIAHVILVIVYHLHSSDRIDEDLGVHCLDSHHRRRTTRRYIHRH